MRSRYYWLDLVKVRYGKYWWNLANNKSLRYNEWDQDTNDESLKI